MIAESTPFGGIELKQASEDAESFLANNEYDHDDWTRWFGKVIDIIDRHDVSMWCYINCDWESQPMWHNVGFGGYSFRCMNTIQCESRRSSLMCHFPMTLPSNRGDSPFDQPNRHVPLARANREKWNRKRKDIPWFGIS